MQRPETCYLGASVIIVGVVLRLRIVTVFFGGGFSWSGDFERSPDGIRLHALTDILNIMILSGVLLALIGWFLPKPPKSNDKT